jgi:hypothetical protein
MTPITGSIVALTTPMHTDGSVDYPTLRKLIDWHIAEGTDCIGVVGTTGESPTVNVEEHCEIIRVSVEQAAQHTERHVFKSTVPGPFEVSITQQQGRQRHGSGFSYQRTRKRHKGQHDKIRGELTRHGDHSGKPAYEATDKFKDRATCSHHHDRKHEKWLGEIARVHVLNCGGYAGNQRHHNQQHKCPHTEHCLNLRQKMPQASVRAVLVR